MTRGQWIDATATLVWALLLTLAIKTLAVSEPREPAVRAFLDPPGSMPGNHAVPAIAPDPRVQWLQYPVGGLLLCNPAERDSSGGTPYITIPPGSVLVIPVPVSDSTRTQEGD